MPTKSPVRTVLRWVLAALYFLIGVQHLIHPAQFIRITPSWVPDAPLVITLTGLCELAGAVALAFIPWLRRAAGIAFAVYAICVYPANINHMMLDMARSDHGAGLAYHLPRLAMQPVLVWLALWVSGVTNWPWHGKSRGCSRLNP